MPGPLIATKLHAPRLRRDVVARRRILERLGRVDDARLTLVSAPAGFGKTTLLTEWLAGADGDDRAVAWLSLDEADRDPATFWAYVVAALEKVVPGVSAAASELLAAAPIRAEQLLAVLVNEVAALPREVWLVLDDYHLADGPEIGEGVAFLLEHLPPQTHVAIGTRADPGLPLARWRARGELVEIRAADLRFTADEAATYLRGAGLELAADDIAVLEERTEGWIAALQLVAISLRGRDDGSGFVARFAGNDRYVVDYLIEEVLAHQTAAVRDFLLRSSVLDRLVGPLCDALTDRDDGSTTLVALERANLFLVALDDRREWYRYHHLFADVLRARLLDEQPDLVPLLHGRASRWFEDHELAEDAVRHALAAADAERAARLIEQALPSLRRDRRDAVLVGWLQALPDDVVRRSPVLAVFSGHLLMASGDLDGAEGRLDAAEQALAAVPQGEDPPWADSEELRSLPATIAVFRASLAQARGDGAGTAGHARRALLLAGPDDHLARSAAAGFLGLSEWVTGDVSTALATFGQAVASLRAAGNVIDELGSTVVLADMEVSAGRPSRARALYERALQRAEAHGRPVARAVAELHVGLGELDVEIGRLAEAGRHLDTAAALAAPAATTESSHRWFVAMAAAARAEGDPARAIALLDQAEQLYRPGFFPDVRPIAALRARIWIAEGRLAEADDWARRRDVAGGGGFLREFDQLTLVRLLLAQHRAHQGADPAGQAVALLERLHGAAEASGRARSVLEIRLLAALAHDARGRSAEALETLAQALTLAPEPEGAARLFLDEGAPMTALLGELQRRRLAGDHPRRILTAGAAEAGGTESPGAAPRLPLADPLSERELQVLTLLDSELSGPEIARRLFVSDNTLRSHTKHIFTKLGVTSRRAAVRIGHERGLI